MTTPKPNEGEFDAEIFRADLDIDFNNLNQAFLNQAALYAYYSGIHAQAMRHEARQKLMLEVEEAKIAKAIRDKAAADGTKITEKQIEQEISRTASYVKAVIAYNDAKAQTAVAAGAIESFRQRRDMLIQLGAQAREELKGEVRAFGAGRAPQAA